MESIVSTEQVLPIENRPSIYENTFFSGTYTDEYIFSDGVWQAYPVGSVLRALLEIPDSCFESLLDLSRQLKSFDFDLKQNKFISPFEHDVTYGMFLNCIQKIHSFDLPLLLKNLFKYLPAQYNFSHLLNIDSYMRYFNDYILVPPVYPYFPSASISNQEELHKITAIYASPNEFIIFKQVHWRAFLYDLGIYHRGKALALLTRDHPVLLSRFYDIYAESFDLLVKEAYQIKKILLETIPTYETSKDKAIIESVCDKLPNLEFTFPSIVTQSEWKIIRRTNASPFSRRKYYKVTSLSSLVYLEMELILHYDLFFKECACCKNTFVTYNALAKYCRFPNKTFQGKTCQDAGPHVAKDEIDTLRKTRNKNRDAYKKWSEPIIKQERKYLEDLYTYIIKDDNYGRTVAERKKFYRSMIQQVKRRYKSWCKKSKTAIEKYDHDKLTKSKCNAKIAYPLERARGPKLYDALHAMRGITTDE